MYFMQGDCLRSLIKKDQVGPHGVSSTDVEDLEAQDVGVMW